MENRLDTPLALAVRTAGSQSAFGRVIRRPQSTVHYWLKNDLPLPAEHVLDAERGTGVPRYRLRPDLYPVEELPHAASIGPVEQVGSYNKGGKVYLGEPVR